jgi:hypothetical protein
MLEDDAIRLVGFNLPVDGIQPAFKTKRIQAQYSEPHEETEDTESENDDIRTNLPERTGDNIF